VLYAREYFWCFFGHEPGMDVVGLWCRKIRLAEALRHSELGVPFDHEVLSELYAGERGDTLESGSADAVAVVEHWIDEQEEVAALRKVSLEPFGGLWRVR